MSKISKIWSSSEKIWYDELRVVHPYREYQYDKTIQSTLKTIFSEFIPVKYNLAIQTTSNPKGSIPDFALIREDYKEWWIVEVERIEDRLSHVKMQIDNFTNGNYNSVIQAKHLYKNEKSLAFERLKVLTQNLPKVLLIVDDINSKWIEELSEFEPSICVLKLYRNNRGLELYSISGDYPYIYEGQSHCSFNDAMSNLLRLTNPDVLNPIIDKKKKHWIEYVLGLFRNHKKDNKDVYKITYKGQVTEWKKVIQDEVVFLQPIGPHALRVNDSYILKRTTFNTYTIELN